MGDLEVVNDPNFFSELLEHTTNIKDETDSVNPQERQHEMEMQVKMP
jgi:hypothetical protein